MGMLVVVWNVMVWVDVLRTVWNHTPIIMPETIIPRDRTIWPCWADLNIFFPSTYGLHLQHTSARGVGSKVKTAPTEKEVAIQSDNILKQGRRKREIFHCKKIWEETFALSCLPLIRHCTDIKHVLLSCWSALPTLKQYNVFLCSKRVYNLTDWVGGLASDKVLIIRKVKLVSNGRLLPAHNSLQQL